jgi:SAM-dependent methyltransferase
VEQDVKIEGLPQPLGFYHVLTGVDHLHFGYWPDGEEAISLAEAQERLTGLLYSMFLPPPARILDVGCGLGATAADLCRRGYEVVAIAPSLELTEFASEHHPGPTYLPCGFLDEEGFLSPPEHYDVILFQESLQYFPNLGPVFEKAGWLLAPGGRMLLCDEVSYSADIRDHSAVHVAADIEQALGAAGFHVCRHHRIGPQVQKTCSDLLALFRTKRRELIETFGNGSTGEIDHYVRGWERQQDWYRSGQFGYEVWDARNDGLVVRPFKAGDEGAILEMFREVFQVDRSLDHWSWEFLENPFGGPQVITVWDGNTLVSNYAACPSPFWMDDHMILVNQGVDTMTLPSHRGVGRGPTSLLARAVRLFYRLHCEGKVGFYYGFNTGRIQKFGRMFLDYSVVAQVTEWRLADEPLETLAARGRWKDWLCGYSASEATEVSGWADAFFASVRARYGRLIARNSQYLTWRYLNHPTFDYVLVVVRQGGRVVGWWLVKVEGEAMIIGDALFVPEAIRAPVVGLSAVLRILKGRETTIREIRGWFSEHPPWWANRLKQLGFKPHREPNNLSLCMNTFLEPMEPQAVADRMYFTNGDSDLF